MTDVYVLTAVEHIRSLLYCEGSSAVETYQAKICNSMVEDGKILLYFPKIFSILHCRQAQGTLDQDEAGRVPRLHVGPNIHTHIIQCIEQLQQRPIVPLSSQADEVGFLLF